MYTFSFLLINLNIKYFLRSHYGKKSKIYGISFKGAIYTLVFVLLGIVLIISLIFMFCNKNQGEKETKTTYQ